MLSQRLANIVFAVVLIGACAYLSSIAWGFEAVGLLGTSGVPPSFFPLLMLGLIVLAALLVLIAYARHGEAGGDAGEMVYESAGDARRGVLMIALAVACYLVWTNSGFIPMAALMSLGGLVVMGVRSPAIYATVALLAVAIYFLFTRVLGAQLG